MKLTVLKVLSLLVFLGGILILGLITEGGDESGFFTSNYMKTVDALSTGGGEEGPGSLTAFGIVAGLLMTVLGLYGFVPKLPARRDTFTYQGPAGEVTLPLDAIERSLQKLVTKMSEVKKARVHINPEASGKQVEIRVQAILVKPEGASARATIDRVHTMIHRAAKEHLGLEELGPIAFNVGFAMNPTAAERGMRQEVQAAEARGETLLAAPGVESVIAAAHDEPEPDVDVDPAPLDEQPLAEVAEDAEEAAPEPAEVQLDEDEAGQAEVAVEPPAEATPILDEEPEAGAFPTSEEALEAVEEPTDETVVQETAAFAEEAVAAEEAGEEEAPPEATPVETLGEVAPKQDLPLAAYVDDELETPMTETAEAEDLVRDAMGSGEDELATHDEVRDAEAGELPDIPEALEEDSELPKPAEEDDDEEPLPPYNP